MVNFQGKGGAGEGGGGYVNAGEMGRLRGSVKVSWTLFWQSDVWRKKEAKPGEGSSERVGKGC